MEVLHAHSDVLVGVLLTNIGALISFFISLKVGLAKLEVKVDALDKDLNNLGGMLRQLKKGEENA